jgi:membrane protease YdiL (CAAX protease family)
LKKEIKFLTASALFTLLLLMVSGAFDGVLQTITYICAFLLPAFICLYMYFQGEKKSQILSSEWLAVKGEGIAFSVCAMPLAILLTLSVSVVTALLLGLFGFEKTTVINEPPLLAILLHALLPALLEEIGFRYLPLRILGKRAPRFTVFFSAALFSLLHHSLYSIPYALVAGVIFMAVDLAFESVIPSIFIHFVNNVVALLTMGALGVSVELYVIFIVLGALSLLSALVLLLFARRAVIKAASVFVGEQTSVFPTQILFLAAPSILLAVLELWG